MEVVKTGEQNTYLLSDTDGVFSVEQYSNITGERIGELLFKNQRSAERFVDDSLKSEESQLCGCPCNGLDADCLICEGEGSYILDNHVMIDDNYIHSFDN